MSELENIIESAPLRPNWLERRWPKANTSAHRRNARIVVTSHTDGKTTDWRKSLQLGETPDYFNKNMLETKLFVILKKYVNPS